MCADHVQRSTDAQSKLEASLSVVRGSDGGASAVLVDLTNTSPDDDVVLKVNSVSSAFIMLTVADEHGTVLSQPARAFDSSEVQRFETVRIARGSAHQWRVPIVEQMQPSALPPGELKGRLVVNILLLFRKVTDNQPASDDEFESSIVTLYDMDVLFTRAALREG
jgi:hypothetical protein